MEKGPYKQIGNHYMKMYAQKHQYSSQEQLLDISEPLVQVHQDNESPQLADEEENIYNLAAKKVDDNEFFISKYYKETKNCSKNFS